MASSDKHPRCGATMRGPDGKLRCTLPARHDKATWHTATEKQVEARWTDEGSYELFVPTHRGTK